MPRNGEPIRGRSPNTADGSPKRSAAISTEPVIAVPPAVAARYNARVLDPGTAARVSGQAPVRPTVYLADRLLVSGSADQLARDRLTEAAEDKNLKLVPPLAHVTRRDALVAAAGAAGHDNADALFTTMHQLEPVEDVAVAADAWEVLQTYRAKAGDHGGRHVGLDHLLTATRHVEWTPYDPPGFGGGATASLSYGQVGWGGRQPVTWLGPAPARRDDVGCRRPVVAILDSGVGEHPWLPVGPDSCVHRDVTFGGAPLGLPDGVDFEGSGVVSDPLEGVLDAYSGHGTFIAGLIRQQCPDADILSVRVMPTDGACPEHVVLDALNALAARQLAAQQDGRPDEIVDVVSLSLGYYPEHDDAASAHPFLYDAIEKLGRCGVIVVASAGNDATSRPMYPAAFTPFPDGLVTQPDPDCVPVVSVGALNPDGTVALFSNDGDWVVCTEPGAGVVSTFPPFDASGQSAYSFDDAGQRRATIDPDNFTSGFGVWSGTSFAAPILAGKIAQCLLTGACGSTDAIDTASTVDRAWAALATQTPVRRP